MPDKSGESISSGNDPLGSELRAEISASIDSPIAGKVIKLLENAISFAVDDQEEVNIINAATHVINDVKMKKTEAQANARSRQEYIPAAFNAIHEQHTEANDQFEIAKSLAWTFITQQEQVEIDAIYAAALRQLKELIQEIHAASMQTVKQ